MKGKLGADKQIKTKNRSAMKIRRWKEHFVITLRILDKPRRSKSGKSVLIASSVGVRRSKLKFEGQSIRYVANVFCYPEAKPSPPSGRTKKRGNQSGVAPRKLHRRQKTKLPSKRRMAIRNAPTAGSASEPWVKKEL